jgi:hypothetical protein
VAGKQSYELWAEAIRDVGILLLVFAPLDARLPPGRSAARKKLLRLADEQPVRLFQST